MYKDKAKQREAAKAAKKRYKERQADIAVREALGIPTEGIPTEGIPSKGIPPIEKGMTITPEGAVSNDKLPVNYGQPDCQCRHCQQTKTRRERGYVINHGKYKTAAELADNEVNRIALPGDIDYIGVANTPQSHTKACKEMLKAKGYPYFQAQGIGGAEL